MSFKKHKKTIIGLTAAALMTLGSVTAFAASQKLILTPVDSVDITKIDAPMGDPSDIKVAGEVDPKILEGMKNAKTAPKASSQLTLTPVDNVDVTKIDAPMGDPSQIKEVGKIDSKVSDGQNKTTAPRK